VRLSEATIQEQVFGKSWRPASKVMPGTRRARRALTHTESRMWGRRRSTSLTLNY
jgi:hypothetical protein